MQKVFKALSFAVISTCLITPNAQAERYRGALAPAGTSSSSNRGTALKTKTSASKPSSTVFGGLELRPSLETTEGSFTTENSLWLGMGFSSWSLSYAQDIESGPSAIDGSHEASIGDGHVKAKFDNIWTDGKTGFHDEFRIYAPTNAAKRDAGMVTVLRNYFKLSHKISPVVTLGLAEVPILHIYSDDGVLSSTGPTPNPSFENRIILGLDFSLSEAVTFSFPLHFYTVKYRNFVDGAPNNDEWDPKLFFWPEINWRVNGGPVTLGAAFRSNNLTKVTEEGTSSDFNGTFQAVFGVSF